jgi:beta-lactamase regulating signal transducer with metallopeptidase domain
VLNHELTHIRRKDHLYKPFSFLLLSVYWFNPILWLSYIMLCKDIESACDEAVIKDMKNDDKKLYLETLLTCSIQRHLVMACL